ncbi:lytic transglycosylase [Serratia marcescens]|uniref:lytic transglycosylase n=1 Tax=Serratia marcescens TaxID=615 RepID=UPI001C8C63BC|nr:lytic transglycosylase [Serratia marcescens]MBX9279934.1 lytic transglycosylase [Serratia marcescens]MBX9284948.1 lytic transglycosylase [Serratia marcescens]MBX9289962.1 lytic transglycosylase [Serratia marcescens]MBX9299463.1 lytic transglycosylase [Serratia marcescens]MBX9304482.1 lytic transglycosylase [Serratia marcescens]
MAIKIPVSAQFDAADLKQQIQMVNDQIRILASQVGQANKQKFEPINLRSKDDLDAFIKQMQKLLSIQTELKQNMGRTGQGAANPLMADWSKMYADQAVRIKKMQSMLQFLGVEFNDLPAPKAPKAPTPKAPPVPAMAPPPPAGPNAGSAFTNALRGSTAIPGAHLFSGMSAGAGGGVTALMGGLAGGLIGFGISKVVGAIADKISAAQDNAVGYDRLYRAQGGTVGFSMVRASMQGYANTNGLSNQGAIEAASAYLSNAAGRGGVGAGLDATSGLARQYGLNYGATAGAFGSMVGASGVSTDNLRRLGIQIGEGIARSGQFAAAGDMLSAVADFGAAQARQTFNTPNMPGYTAALSGMMATGAPGADLQGSVALLTNANRAIMAGGNFGNASQALSARMGLRMGINNPMMLQTLLEGGAFGTASSQLGAGSLYGNTFGNGPEGDTTNLERIRAEIRREYSNDRGMQVQALKNYFGTSTSGAIMLNSLTPSQINGANSRLKRLGLDRADMAPGAAGALGVIEGGTGAQVEALGNNLLNSKPLTAGERETLTKAMAGNDAGQLRDALTKLTVKYGSSETEGSKTTDSVNRLNNTLENYADKAIPALNMMRMALVKASGGSESDLRSSYYATEKASRRNGIDAKYASSYTEVRGREKALIDKYGSATRIPADEYAPINARLKALNTQVLNEKSAADIDVYKNTYGDQSSGLMRQSSLSSPAAASIGSRANGTGSGAAGNWAGNNVGNVKDANGNWRRFPTQQAGVAASAGQLLRYSTGAFKGGRKRTLREIVATYASGDPEAPRYIQQASKWTGFDPDQELDLRDQETLKRVTAAVLRKENTKNTRLPVSTVEAGINDALRNSFNYSADRGQLNVNGGQMEIVVKDQRGNVLQTQQQPVTASFQQSRSWVNRNR